MASTNKTPNLGLCQWEASDPFLREDMNGDFARIDGAVKELWEKKSRVRLFQIQVEQSVAAIELDFSDIDMTQFIELEIYLLAEDEITELRFAAMRLNGYNENNYTYNSSNHSYFPMKYGKNVLSFGGRFIAKDGDTGTLNAALIDSPITSITLFHSYSNHYYKEGTEILVYGVMR